MPPFAALKDLPAGPGHNAAGDEHQHPQNCKLTRGRVRLVSTDRQQGY